MSLSREVSSSNYVYPVRLATLSDFHKISQLCKRAVGEDDYVLSVLRKTIAKEGLYLALDHDKAIGIANFQEAIDGSGWLSMARTDPAYRGNRIAGMLQSAIASSARVRGVQTLRLWIEFNNKASIKAARRGGFRPVSAASHLQCHLKGERKSDGIAIPIRPSPHEIATVLHSSYLAKMHGYLPCRWQFLKPTISVIRRLAEIGQVFRSKEHANVFFLFSDLSEDWEEPRHGEFSLLSGPLTLSLEIVKKYATSMGLRTVGSFFPFDPYILKVARWQQRFSQDTWGKHCVLFEKTTREE